ncbi:PREDICTED: bone morphogenetic protein 2-like [Nanorana parkeri]|uniref:bone morphogenetic protein 2-like n=1 Tax=Nanorana parkeri TaxID=125878 RepID=UPI00085474BF|nr:PREDICTED: bone morphogenetic protein 2-like [Nanorana parkeri]
MVHTTMLDLALFVIFVHGCTSRPTENLGDIASPAENPSQIRSEALRRLLKVFGIDDPPHYLHHVKQPPQYMIDLYNTIADADGVTKDPDLLEGNTVRSFFDKVHSDQLHFLFNLSTVTKNEKILTAELHLFKLKPRPTDYSHFKRHHFCQINVYLVLDKNKMHLSQGRKQLSSKLVPIHSSGWEVFSITQAVHTWNDVSNNQGILVTVRNLGGGQPDANIIRFASGKDHHESKQPMLVLFTDDGRRGVVSFSNQPDNNQLSIPNEPYASAPNRTRMARALQDDGHAPCQRHPLYVDFEEIGWSGWIISPRGYNAYHCKGLCPFPLGENMRPTNHATVQSIINALRLTQGVNSPCCVPDKLFSINLLYFDDDENVVLKQYDDMVAGSCGCH